MEQYELELLQKYIKQDTELNELWQKHMEYENLLEKLENKPFHTPQEELEIKELKKNKLAGKTKIQSLLEKYRKLEEGDEA